MINGSGEEGGNPKGLITLIEKVLQNKLYQCWSKYFIIIIIIIIIKLQSFIINPIHFNTSYREDGGRGWWGGGACNLIYFCCLPLDGPVTGAGANANNNNDDDDDKR